MFPIKVLAAPHTQPEAECHEDLEELLAIMRSRGREKGSLSLRKERGRGWAASPLLSLLSSLLIFASVAIITVMFTVLAIIIVFPV